MTDAEWERLKRVAFALEQLATEMEQRAYQECNVNRGAPSANQTSIEVKMNQVDDKINHLTVA